MNRAIILFGLIFLIYNTYGQYQNNEDGQYEDMLTPEYYNTPNGGAFRLEVNKFVHFARQLPFQNPFQDSLGQMQSYTINRSFGDGIGPGGTGSHHPANDYYVNGTTQVNLYAAHDGIVAVSRDVSRYRHYLSITTDINDSLNNTIGKIVTIYAHIDLDLDSIDSINLDGQYVNKGDLVSKHLYSGTAGGPHLHFEIRYYRPTDTGLEDFYGGHTGDNTSPSSGSWTYGYWNPNHGYGFANPDNHLNYLPSGIISNDFENGVKCYPNPTKGIVNIKLDKIYQEINYSFYSINGKIIEQNKIENNDIHKFNLTNLKPGVYMLLLSEDRKDNKALIKVIKE